MIHIRLLHCGKFLLALASQKDIAGNTAICEILHACVMIESFVSQSFVSEHNFVSPPSVSEFLRASDCGARSGAVISFMLLRERVQTFVSTTIVIPVAFDLAVLVFILRIIC